VIFSENRSPLFGITQYRVILFENRCLLFGITQYRA
jgi:hypothetical protein